MKNSMILPLEEFKSIEMSKEIIAEPASIATPSGVLLAGTVKLKIKYMKMGADYLVRGRLQTRLTKECARCLSTTTIPLDDDFYNVYTVDTSFEEELDLEISKEDLETSVVREDFINLEQLIIEQIVLHIPIKPLCKDDCKGLCQICGADLNSETCGCEQNSGDPRFAVLKNLLEARKQ